jgi:hypothetical protein
MNLIVAKRHSRRDDLRQSANLHAPMPPSSSSAMPSFSTLDAGQEYSLLTAKSGAKHVYAVDTSDIAEKAGQIVRANRLENVIM